MVLFWLFLGLKKHNAPYQAHRCFICGGCFFRQAAFGFKPQDVAAVAQGKRRGAKLVVTVGCLSATKL
jgi:hypothetical protein